MEQIEQIETEIQGLKREKRFLEEEQRDADYYEELSEEIEHLNEKIRTRQQLVRTIVNNRNIQNTSQTQHTQPQGEIQELKQILLRLERKVDQLQGQVNQFHLG
ncbi:5290_t:CDS:1 [Ambispora leptoticha]|uniref:5290_t:CDS:1 n=1 Tax=Ambispora leptoticha TaxID=144679 RepID=A0A9N9FQS9_9GLOM|nr:5290_t:CDS:1 [Ambispora leptoticha]